MTDAELAAMRETSKSALPAVCTITRAGVPGGFNPTTGRHTEPVPTTVYTGACRVRTLHTQDMAGVVGGLHESLSRYVATLPFDAGDIWVDDFLTVTAGTDDNLIGRPLRVTDVQYSEWRIDRRLILEDEQQP